ncbi:MAG: hypothetical protein AAGJ28_07560 [Pseudomonadota bacterium]
MITQFFDRLSFLARHESNVNPDLMEHLTLDEFIARLDGGQT